MEDPHRVLHLDVPYMAQSRYATCGPACLMMVAKYWDDTVDLSPSLEHRLWLKGLSLLFFGGTLPSGLALAATTLQLRAEIYQQARPAPDAPRPLITVRLNQFLNRRRLRSRQIPLLSKPSLFPVIEEALQRRIPPVVLVNLNPIQGENVFHWVVVTGLDEQTVFMNDPYIPLAHAGVTKKDYPVPRAVFLQAMATDSGRTLRLPPTVVLVFKP